jgi:hypothetical protein
MTSLLQPPASQPGRRLRWPHLYPLVPLVDEILRLFLSHADASLLSSATPRLYADAPCFLSDDRDAFLILSKFFRFQPTMRRLHVERSFCAEITWLTEL